MNKILIAGAFVVLLIIGCVLFVINHNKSAYTKTQDEIVNYWLNVTPSVNPQGFKSDPISSEKKEETTIANQISLFIDQPSNGIVVSNPLLTVRGKTNSNAEIVVNDKETNANSSGNFSVTLTLDEGENSIIIVANDELGNIAEKELLVTYETIN